MGILGVPSGWTLAGFRVPSIGEWIIDTDGTPYQVHHDNVTEVLPVIVQSEPLLDAVGRLRAWIREFGDQKQPEFVTDLKTVLDFVSPPE